jgi:xylan 1,4-beta-xylosidase
LFVNPEYFMNLHKSPLLLLWSLLFASLALGAMPEAVHFESFRYEGNDPVFETPLPEGYYRNPVIAGFYPDPSICRVEDRYYLVNSTFSYFPGIPIFESTDLVNWKQIGNVMDRPSQMNTRGTGISKGIFAPTIRYHDGLFYVICTLVGCGGNYIVTAEDPAGPWSEPVWLPEVEGIDPSLFFDDDGRVYIVHNGNPPDNEPLYQGHRAIWLWEYDLEKQAVIGEGRIIVNGGVDLSKEPIWIEGPHLLKKDGWYYLNCAEGGTSWDHSQVIFRSRSLDEPFVPNPQPMLTQRDLDNDRPDPVACTGHADFVETTDGEWWAVFLGTRPFGQQYYLTGRETFMLPVSWDDEGWPEILPSQTPVPYEVEGPSIYQNNPTAAATQPMTGNFVWEDRFAGDTLAFDWVMLRTSEQPFYAFGSGEGIDLLPQQARLDSLEGAAYLGRRQQHTHFTASTKMQVPGSENIIAGLALYLTEGDHFFLGARRTGNGKAVISLEKAKRGDLSLLDETEIDAPVGSAIEFVVNTQAGLISFSVVDPAGVEHRIIESADSSFLTGDGNGVFIGCTVGIHARVE